MLELIHKIEDAFTRHERVGFQFSGGKDSTAALWVLRDYWEAMTIYWLNTGDMFPETENFIRNTLDGVRNVVEVKGQVWSSISRYGIPSDIIPYGSSEVAWMNGLGKTVRMQDRLTCCARGKMMPMHNAMLADEITLIVRGQKNSDEFPGPMKSGSVSDGFEFLYPVEGWTDSDVMKFLIDNEYPVPPLYADGLLRSGDCMRCSAWMGDALPAYLHKHHKEAFYDYKDRVSAICDAASTVMGSAFSQMETCALKTEEEHQ